MWLIFSFYLSTLISHGEVTRPTATEPLENISEQNQDVLCRDLRPGESTTVNESTFGVWAQSRDYGTRNFKVSRSKSNAKEFQVDLHVEFRKEGTQEPFTKDQNYSNLQNKYLKKANDCFEQYREKLKAPDGSHLFIRMNKDKLTPKLALPIFISPGEGNNSLTWNQDISCPTLIHETLHRLGLCDGYHGSKKNSDGSMASRCRPTEPRESIMNAPKTALNAAGKQYDILICQNESGSQKSPAQLISQNEQWKCPERSKEKKADTFVDAQLLEIYKSYQDISGLLVLYKPSAPVAHPLQQAHIRFITKPKCIRDNNLYIRCMANGNRWTDSPGGCLVVPKACQTGEYLK